MLGARALYESVLDDDERIPWEWLARTPDRRREWQPGQRRSHLVVAHPANEREKPNGFGYGAFLPGYGGYVCYLAVDPAARARGIGTRLFGFLFKLIEEAARASALALPFVIWESHRPADPDLWRARLRLFDRVGGRWLRGVRMLTPNYMQPDGAPVSLHLFLRPWDESESSFGADRLRAVMTGLYEQIYRIPPDDPLHRDSLANAVNPRLVSAVEALED